MSALSRLNRVLRGAVRRGLAWSGLRPAPAPRDGGTDAPPRRALPPFRDSSGAELPRFEGYRDWLKPDWRRMFDPPPELYEAETFAPVVAGTRRSIAELKQVLSACGASLESARVIEVGTYNGARAFALAAAGAGEVTALDLPEYYVQQRPGAQVDAAAVAHQAERLERLRGAVQEAFVHAGVATDRLARVRFLDEDASATSLPSGEFDAVVSWEVLEHLRDPRAAFREIFRLLKPGGVVFHEYNPFFSINGGHSLCTLEIPYGHARLSDEDFEAYVRRFRPEEADVDLRFFHHNLNRMSLADLDASCVEAGFELLAAIEWPTASDLQEVDPAALRQVRRHHPTVTLNDLMVRTVWVVLRKPGGAS